VADPAFEREVERNFRWNFAVNLVDISFIMLGISLVSRETVIPLLVSKLTPSPIAIGLVPAVYSLGMYLPQLLGASVAEGMPRKKTFVAIIGGFGERMPFLFASLAVLWLAVPMPGTALVALVAAFGISGASAGFATPAWFDLISKVIPVRRRGLFTGTGFGLGALMGVAGAVVIGFVLERWPYPQSFALLFALAACSMTISWIGLAINREPANPSVRPRVSLSNYLRRLPGTLRADRNFARYIGAMAVARAGTMAGGFYLVYGAERFQISGAEVGLLTGVLIGCQALLNPLWGLIGDRYGHKLVLVGGALALALAAATASLAPSWPWLVLVFGLVGAFLSADSASFLTIIPEFCADEDRPTYIGLTNTLLAPVTTLAPLLGGWLAVQLGYPPMFAFAGLLAGLGAGLLARQVREPRRAKARAQASPTAAD
jgi:MFS family permease